MLVAPKTDKNIELYKGIKILYLTDNVYINSNINTKGKWHSIILISNGSAIINIDFDEHIALKNKVFYIEKNKIFNWFKTEGINGIMVQFTDTFYNFIYTGNQYIKSDQVLVGDFPPFIKLENVEVNEWNNLLNVIKEEYRKNVTYSKEIICMTLKTILMFYRRKSSFKEDFSIASRKKQIISDFIKLVNSKFTELKTNTEYAEKLNISPNYLNALCKEMNNKTASEVIKDRIVLEAKRMLTHSSLSVSEISNKLGFKDNSYFGRYFKKATGISPEKFRTFSTKMKNTI